jgi:GTP-binding protein Era
VAVVGRPNVGKSTLVNRLVGARVSITSRKAQTTRHRVTGILTTTDAQIVFVDTPGYQTRRLSTLTRRMNRTVNESLAGVDAVVFVVEALKFGEADREALRLVSPGAPVVVAINKTDLVRERDLLLPFMAALAKERDFAALVPVSAERGTRVDDLVRALVPLLPESPPIYGPDDLTDRDERFLAAEYVREKIFRLLGEEVPYATAVVIDAFEHEGEVRRIRATVLVDRASQRPILLGKGGATMKRIASEARADMEALFGGRVFLEVWVQVKRGWSEDEAGLRRLGLA